MDVRKRFFTRGVVVYWNRLPGEVVSALSLLEFKNGLDNARTYGLIFEWSYVESGVGLDNVCGSLPTWDSLWFYFSLPR